MLSRSICSLKSENRGARRDAMVGGKIYTLTSGLDYIMCSGLRVRIMMCTFYEMFMHEVRAGCFTEGRGNKFCQNLVPFVDDPSSIIDTRVVRQRVSTQYSAANLDAEKANLNFNVHHHHKKFRPYIQILIRF